MRYLVLTDIHANLEALTSCLTDAEARGFDAAVVLGDIVGYGPDPNAVIDRIVRLKPAAVVRGNHDKVALGMSQADGFHAAARAAASWMLDSLTPAHREWLAALPMGPLTVAEGLEICHGSPQDEDAYIFEELEARYAFARMQQQVCFYGHTHFAVAFRLTDESLDVLGPVPGVDTVVRIEAGARYLINPGAVGQPRDGDPRAAYAIYDTDTAQIDLIRVDYAIETTQEKMRRADLPEPLVRRLSAGR
jgi:diadenosine tetraphosphatase ApaH/serine/threonine PP2A family protein phosphatase